MTLLYAQVLFNFISLFSDSKMSHNLQKNVMKDVKEHNRKSVESGAFYFLLYIYIYINDIYIKRITSTLILNIL